MKLLNFEAVLLGSMAPQEIDNRRWKVLKGSFMDEEILLTTSNVFWGLE